ncbi:hypothetical protein PPACK8108_LOCUS23970 [Phakopsora pachyrhizi]|uniref:Uncharacterized protein n=1 Tax=Phakopsora pachyrhizi TaxID=170000 RepID=A0AAV0BQI9_PHAPC|nr:hypothetical protein PPACK8108_LOCUS23970 [Phakopsora pachyrhizi]
MVWRAEIDEEGRAGGAGRARWQAGAAGARLGFAGLGPRQAGAAGAWLGFAGLGPWQSGQGSVVGRGSWGLARLCWAGSWAGGSERRPGLSSALLGCAKAYEERLEDPVGGNLNQISRVKLMHMLARTEQPTSVPVTDILVKVSLALVLCPEDETEPGWDSELRDDVKSECEEKYGNALADIMITRRESGQAGAVGAWLGFAGLGPRQAGQWCRQGQSSSDLENPGSNWFDRSDRHRTNINVYGPNLKFKSLSLSSRDLEIRLTESKTFKVPPEY